MLRLLDSDSTAVAFAKIVDHSAPPHLADDLEGEAARLKWLSALGIPVAKVLAAGTDITQSWLVTQALPGRPASDPWPTSERAAVVDLLAAAARKLHDQPTNDVLTFDGSIPFLLSEIRERVSAGIVDRAWAAAGKSDTTAASALAELECLAAAIGKGSQSLCHGDFCLPNVLIAPAGIVSFVDVGRASLADPHSDLADMIRSLRSPMNPQFGPAYAEQFLDSYGRDRIDPERLRLHDLLESFFWRAP
ncbi:aminoglycoside 3'-phosphotransferase [Kineosporia babensis]